ncbi:MAG TPA: MBL fold metallo-hydrolase [Thermomicrobiaceae bacterium]|nr:MBL fold metallo-hydrolase [Thermomicrobiaceae bacterium]
MDVTVLGTGSPNANRVTTGLVITAPGSPPLVIDTCSGFEFFHQLTRAGFDAAEIKHVVLTHRHLDHIGGMTALFIHEHAFDLYALDDTHAAVEGLMAAGFPEWPINPGIRRLTVRPGEQHEIAGYRVSFYEVIHRVPTVAVRVEHGGTVLAYSADSIPCPAVVACAREADLFLCDACYVAGDGPAMIERARLRMHPTAREAGEMAQEANARSLVLLHLSRFADPARVLAEATERYHGPAVVAEDGGRYQVG